MLQNIEINVFKSQTNKDLEKIVSGLQQPVKKIDTEFTYDENGSQIYDKICKLPEYYPAWQEMAIMEQYIDEIVSLVGANCLLIDYGSGSSDKTCILLNRLPQIAGYIPIDISKKYLIDSATKIAENYPNLEVLPVCTNYHDYFEIPSPKKLVKRRLAFISGITIGNEHPPQLISLLKNIKQTCGSNGAMLVSVDLKKDLEILNSAYNDSSGLNVAIALNFLQRMNRELNANFKINQFQYKAIYNEQIGRMEMKLFSLQKQSVNIGKHCFEFKVGEPILLAYSYKYNLNDFANIAARGGWEVNRVWTDPHKLFSIQYLTVAPSVKI
ncbi:L-histidine N(alpha)-methyltransferase [Aetokthonos hydrillicola Thurmond2011]|uniref:L-histidine N(Alpha)-methyltransferase n=1 Tax=Aetokthonos hydrillicola Thurmond2011 TaxID=2712845 RepID=A0AAP5I819_9CYAN|nr:L-histidine N(alpha)-methyltransferase [Aetokthonos hydrillicola]MBO3460587.1 L-histidine N(alpha)-methyltransferase [Aetokthonos hydrillicola CCALA 1050]MBW4585285.1 L-histidine N(alpha)-methyltransferase [Aetokthonos hydrillicola CCALA 1050]MDR9896581.1 L-histidine N(alpha)-methyltransferase [Aetokthonos hydrillicola Thurmond2011]